MKGKYITTSILMACKSKRKATNIGIHEELNKTIAEHKKIMKQWEEIFEAKLAKVVKVSTNQAA